ncbi:MAG TPA: GNAT family N-acetyltransferase [Thermoplasmata archaeon]|nr:GNAT family N-acetyltransferase [Thermoplasmata archaeon]
MVRGPRTIQERIGSLRYPLRGRRVDLVLPDPHHIRALVRLLSEPSVARVTLSIPFPYSASDARHWIARAGRGRRAGERLSLSVVRRADDALLGGVGLHQFDGAGSRAEVGYWLGREYRGQGYAAEAVNVLLRVAFRELRLHRVEARIFPGNRSSQELARRCGFRYEGRLRHEVQKDGRWQDSWLYSRLSTDRPRRRS